jgi:hypothetical protein
MFSDRWWILKAAVAVGLLALLLTDTRRTLGGRHPEIEHVVLNWPPYRDHTFHLAAKQVRAADAGGFTISTRVGPMQVRTPTPPAVGEYVTLNVRPVGPRTLEIVQMAVLQGYVWKRPLNYGVSIVTLVAFLWLVRRRFRWRIQDGVFRSRY